MICWRLWTARETIPKETMYNGVGGSALSAKEQRVKAHLAFVSAVALVAVGCSVGPITPTDDNGQPDSAPRFSETISDLTYQVGQQFCTILPTAVGGNGALSYGLTPAVAGLQFDARTREFHGTPESAGEHTMTYTVEDSDDNTATSDADERTFQLTIESEQQQSTDDPLSSTYSGCGDEVFFLNPAGEAIDRDTPYVLSLGTTSASVYVIATNTSDSFVRTPGVKMADSRDSSTAPLRRAPAGDGLQPRTTSATLDGDHHPEADDLDHPRTTAGMLLPSTAGPVAIAVGDTFAFLDEDEDDNVVQIPATARSVTTAGGLTLIVWVGDANWGRCADCVGQGIVDTVARAFLREGASNDIYDWVTAILGPPWGPHDRPDVIAPEHADQFHILLTDLDGGSNGTFSPRNKYLRAVQPASNERIMVYLDAPRLKDSDAVSGERRRISTIAHELQHAIHNYQKRVLWDVRSETWLNEMASYVIQDLLSNKIMANRPRQVAYDDPTAGGPGNTSGRLPVFNSNNDLNVTAWDRSDSQNNRAVSYALGAYLARNYGGAALFRDIVQNGKVGVEAVEAGLQAQGYTTSFGDMLTNWGVATILSDNEGASLPFRYNPGTWTVSEAGGVAFQLGSINLFNYSPGPSFDSIEEFDAKGPQAPYSNRYAALGRRTGTVRLHITAETDNRITVVVKE